MTKSDIFVILARNRGCGYSLEPRHWGGSNGYPQFMFYSRNKKNNVYPFIAHFFYIKLGLRGSKLHRYVFVISLLIFILLRLLRYKRGLVKTNWSLPHNFFFSFFDVRYQYLARFLIHISCIVCAYRNKVMADDAFTLARDEQITYIKIEDGPSRHITLNQRRFNVDLTSRRWINVGSTLFQWCAPAGAGGGGGVGGGG